MAPATGRETGRCTIVHTATGEEHYSEGDCDDGVWFDGGIIPWYEVCGFKVWDASAGHYVFIPVGDDFEEAE